MRKFKKWPSKEKWVFFFSFYTNNIYIGLNANHLQLNNLILASSQNCIKIGQNKLDINPEELKKKKKQNRQQHKQELNKTLEAGRQTSGYHLS